MVRPLFDVFFFYPYKGNIFDRVPLSGYFLSLIYVVVHETF